ARLLHISVADGLLVELVDLQMSIVDDTVSAFSAFPSGSEQDSMFRITLRVAIPEPSTALLSALGLAGLLVFRRRR
ncbi:MAG TPA: PEP-CTERM sorting domain-containing protein, partial [Verrucomicrobiales bacterium]|nr:PEP-CTERM sorting domain-containing protein [Verrucomicrobiales bacterium]HUF62738.1 PEP-CTERM sorting domain-containing protein [Verrucomicrobiales bacterium]